MENSSTITLLFGSQDLDVNSTSLDELRKALLGSASRQWITEAISDLPKDWERIQATQNAFQSLSGAQLLDQLTTWLRRGKYTGSIPPPNIITTVLTVATHLIQVIDFVEHRKPGLGPDDSLVSVFKTPFQTSGLCTGLLTAAAVSSSSNLRDLQRNGAVALRLAMAIGAFVDAKDGEKWSSLVASWTLSDGDEKLEETVSKHPEVRRSTNISQIHG